MRAGTGRPEITVGLPVHNGEAFLAETIAALLGQVEVDMELVIADNASTDGTEAICRDAGADPRVRYLRSSTNRGAAWNYNRLLDEAQGRYFKWAAHDDVPLPRFLTGCATVLREDPGVSLCYPRAVDIDADGRHLLTHTPLVYATELAASTRAASVLARPTACVEVFGLVRHSQLRQTGLIGPYTSSDRTLLFELSLHGRFHEVPEALFLHRQHAQRSVHAYRGARARDAWFDPARAGRRTLPRWRLLGEHVRAALRAPLPPDERLRTLRAVAAWAPGMARPLARELAGLVRPPRPFDPAAALGEPLEEPAA